MVCTLLVIALIFPLICVFLLFYVQNEFVTAGIESCVTYLNGVPTYNYTVTDGKRVVSVCRTVWREVFGQTQHKIKQKR